MSPFLKRLFEKRIWRRLIAERGTDSALINLLSLGAAAFGSLRTKIDFDLVLRPHNAFGLLYAADRAKERGFSRVTAVEFGVASGAGLINMGKIGERITKETGIEFDIVGFDTGGGMPTPIDYRDHPELYEEGDFKMDQDALRKKLPSNTRLIIGNVAETVPLFLQSASSDSPIGYAVVDVDYYSSTLDAVALFRGPAEQYLPSVFVYADDTYGEFVNPWCGELLAFNEFNEANQLRKIAPYPTLRTIRFCKHSEWLDRVFIMHVLDSKFRSPANTRGFNVNLDNPYMKTLDQTPLASQLGSLQ